jgi:hypothetical protein
MSEEPKPATGQGLAVASEWTVEARELLEKLDDCINTFYPDYGYEWDNDAAIAIIGAAFAKARKQ